MLRYNPNTKKIGNAIQLHSIETIQKILSESEINSPNRRKKENHTVNTHIKKSIKKTTKDLTDLGNSNKGIAILFRIFFIIAICFLHLVCIYFSKIFNGILPFGKEF